MLVLSVWISEKVSTSKLSRKTCPTSHSDNSAIMIRVYHLYKTIMTACLRLIYKINDILNVIFGQN